MENIPPENNTQVPLAEYSKLNFSRHPLAFFSAGAILFLGFFYFLAFSAPLHFPKGIVVSITKGETLRSISLELKEKRVIRSRTSFEAFVILFGGERHIALGDYLFESKMPVFEVASRIAGEKRHLGSVRITIPEGFDVEEIADTVSPKLPNFNRDRFLAQAREGYLFPDTYFFLSSNDERDVLGYLSDNFEKKTKPLSREIAVSGKTGSEIITMASLIEREAKGDADRGYISGILWNRLNKNMPLQVDSAPDTYKKRGLPEHPICNPGLASIRAALHPVKSNFLYYLHDGAGNIHYARTFEEHKANKLKYLK